MSVKRCIVVDDDELTRTLYARRLMRAGYASELHADPEQALAALSAAVGPDRGAAGDAEGPGPVPATALFVDQEMPRLDGIELLEALLPRLDRIAVHVRLCSAAGLRPDVRDRLERLGLQALGKEVLQHPDELGQWLLRQEPDAR